VHLGVGSFLDGGPFVGFEVDRVAGETLHGRQTASAPAGDGHASYTVGEVSDALTDEIDATEPVRVSGVAASEGALRVALPLRRGFLVRFHDGDEALTAAELQDYSHDAWRTMRQRARYGVTLGES